MNNTALMKDVWFVMRRFSVSWMGILVMIIALLVALGGYTAARASLITLFGVLGAVSAYRLHFGDRRVNPYLRLKRNWKMPRMFSVMTVALLSLALSIALFLEGIFMPQGASRMVAVYLAAANGFFIFGAVFGISGWLSVSEACQRLLQASFDEKQRWREEIGRMNAHVSDLRRVLDALYRLSVLPATEFFTTPSESDRSA